MGRKRGDGQGHEGKKRVCVPKGDGGLEGVGGGIKGDGGRHRCLGFQPFFFLV